MKKGCPMITNYSLFSSSEHPNNQFSSYEETCAYYHSNDELNTLFHTIHTFYSPIYEKLSKKDFSGERLNVWNMLSSVYTEKSFYLSADYLFKNNPNANGCYKIYLSWNDILRINPKIAVTPLEQDVYQWQLPLTGEHIHSYIQKRTRQEFINERKVKLNISIPDIIATFMRRR